MGLNPCCSGRWSRTHIYGVSLIARAPVLILVVVDDGLVRDVPDFGEIVQCSLNPCCSGRWSRTTYKGSLG